MLLPTVDGDLGLLGLLGDMDESLATNVYDITARLRSKSSMAM